MASLEIIAKLKNLISPEAAKVKADVDAMAAAVEGADQKAVALAKSAGEVDAKIDALASSVGDANTKVESLAQGVDKAGTQVEEFAKGAGEADTKLEGLAQGIGEADVKAAAFAQRQRMLTAEMNRLAKEVASGKTSVEDASKQYETFEKSLVKVEVVAPKVAASVAKIDDGAAEIPKATSNVEELAKSIGEADIKAAALTQRQNMLSAEMNRLAKEVATGKTTVAEATKKYEEFEKSLGKNDDAAKKSKLSFTELNQALELLKKGIGAVKAVGQELYDTIGEGAKIKAAQNTFENLAASINTTSDALMGNLHGATSGMVSDADLMVAANRFVAMGLANTQEEAGELANIATQLGVAFRGDAVTGMEELALMLANQSIPRLDSFGVSAGKVRERINELMSTQAGMTRETAFMQAFMEQAGVTMEKIGPQSATAAAGLARIEAAVKNMGDEVKATVAQEFAPTMEDLSTTVLPHLADVVSNNVVPAVGELVGLFGDIVNDGKATKDQINSIGDAFDWITGAIQNFRDWREVIQMINGPTKALMLDYDGLGKMLAPITTLIKGLGMAIGGDLAGAYRAQKAVSIEFYDAFDRLPIVGKLATDMIGDLQGSFAGAAAGTSRFTKEVQDDTAAVVNNTQAVDGWMASLNTTVTLTAQAAQQLHAHSTALYQSSDAYAEFQDKVMQTNSVMTEEEAAFRQSQAAAAAANEQFFAGVDATNQYREAVAAMNTTLGDYFAEAAEGGNELQLFTSNLDELGQQTFAVSNLTEAQTEDLNRMQTAYEKAAQTIRDYELGVKGANMTDEERNKKIEEQQAIMATLSTNMQPLLDAGVTMSTANNGLVISTAAVNQELYSMIAAGDGSATSIAAAGLALGIFDEAAAEAYLKTAVLKIELENLAAAYSAGDITLQTMMTGMQTAIQEVNDMSLSMNDATGSVMLFDESTIVATTDTDSLIAKMGEVPDEINTDIDLETGRAMGAISEYINKLNSIPDRIETNVAVVGAGGGVERASGGYQNPEGRSSGGRVDAFKSYLVGDAPGGGITPYTELFIPDQPGFIVNSDTLQRLMGSSSGGGDAAAPFVPQQPVFSSGGGGASIQIINQFNTPVSQDMVGRIAAAQRQAIEQALAERDRRASSMTRMRG